MILISEDIKTDPGFKHMKITKCASCGERATYYSNVHRTCVACKSPFPNLRAIEMKLEWRVAFHRGLEVPWNVAC